ncbi:MAG: MBL fold metallo-hydrolase [Thermoleophilia bacterium]
MEQLTDAVWVHEIVAEGFSTVCAVALTGSRAFVVDTLAGPADVEPVAALVRERAGERRVVVVNTHHHWDHVYGNAAFPGVDLVAQRACPRLLEAQLASADESLPLPPSAGVPLPNVTFGDRLTYVDEDEAVHLIGTPGHSEDSLVVFLAGAGILFGGDTVEWPLPNFSQRGGLEPWVTNLRRLKQLPLRLVVPSHGPAMDKHIIDANERYVAGVREAVTEAKRAGAARHELDLAAARFLDAGVELDEVYAGVHRANLVWAWDEV